MTTIERRSGMDRRTDAEKQVQGGRRSGVDRRSCDIPPTPPEEQLALFARRVRRSLREDKGRGFFGIATGEADFVIYPDVLRVVEWIERLVEARADEQPKPSLRKVVPAAADQQTLCKK